MDQLSAMRLLIRVVDSGSFSIAGRQSRIGQPAVSKAVARLEDNLGVKLLTRTTRGLSPTEAGHRYYALAVRAVEAADEAAAAAKDASAALSGRLRISMAVSFGRLQIIPRMVQFAEAHPNLELDLVMEDRPTDLVEEAVDVALRIGPQPDSRFTGRVIASCERVVVATPEYLASYGTPLEPSDLSRHQGVVLLQAGISNVWNFSRDAETVKISAEGRFRVTANEGLRELVLASLAYAVGTEWGFQRELTNGRVRQLLTNWTLPQAELWAVSPAGRQATAKARSFIDYLERSLAEPLLQP